MKINYYILLLELLFSRVASVKKSRNANKQLSKRMLNMCFWLRNIMYATSTSFWLALYAREKRDKSIFENVRLTSSIASCFTYIIVSHTKQQRILLSWFLESFVITLEARIVDRREKILQNLTNVGVGINGVIGNSWKFNSQVGVEKIYLIS